MIMTDRDIAKRHRAWLIAKLIFFVGIEIVLIWLWVDWMVRK